MELEDIEKLDEATLEKEIIEQRNLLSTDRLDMSFGEIVNMYERKEIIIRPAFQRYFRWNDEQQTRFIESVLLGIPIPPIFVAEDGQGYWELVDGLQRISTILSFFGVLKSNDVGLKDKNNLVLLEGDRVPSLEGFSYNTLPSKLRLNIKRSTCRVEIIRWDRNYDMRFELFNRLNTGGSSLTTQEIRNALYRDVSSKFHDFLKKLSELPEFLQIISLNISAQEQLFHEELVLRFLSLYKNRKDLQKQQVSIAKYMTLFMEKAVRNDAFDYASYEGIFRRTLMVLSKIDTDIIFTRKDGNFAKALYDITIIGISENIELYENQSNLFLEGKIKEVRQDEILMKFYKKGANHNLKHVINRLKEADRIFGNVE